MYEDDTLDIFNKILTIKENVDNGFLQSSCNGDLNSKGKNEHSPVNKSLHHEQFIEQLDILDMGIENIHAKIMKPITWKIDESVPIKISPIEKHKSSPKTDDTPRNAIFDNHSNHSRLTSFQTSNLNVSDAEKYWSRCIEICNNEHRMIWQGLELGFTKYLMVLKERDSLVDRCTKLRRQNYELRHCLQNVLFK